MKKISCASHYQSGNTILTLLDLVIFSPLIESVQLSIYYYYFVFIYRSTFYARTSCFFSYVCMYVCIWICHMCKAWPSRYSYLTCVGFGRDRGWPTARRPPSPPTRPTPGDLVHVVVVGPSEHPLLLSPTATGGALTGHPPSPYSSCSSTPGTHLVSSHVLSLTACALI